MRPTAACQSSLHTSAFSAASSNPRATCIREHNGNRCKVYAYSSAAAPGDLAGAVPAPPHPHKAQATLPQQPYGAVRRKLHSESNSTDQASDDESIPTCHGQVTNLQDDWEDTRVAVCGKAAITFQICSTWFLQFWPCFATGNAIVSSCWAALAASEPTAVHTLTQGLFSAVVMVFAFRVIQYGAAYFLQGLKALGGSASHVVDIGVMEGHLKELLTFDMTLLQPDREEQPTPALQFFFSGTLMSLVGMYLTVAAKECLSYSAFTVSKCLLEIPAVWNSLASVLGICACLFLVMRPRSEPGKPFRTDQGAAAVV